MRIEQTTIPTELEACISFARDQFNATAQPEEAFATDSAYFQQRVFDMLNSWERQRLQSLVAPVDHTPVPVVGIPQSVTRKQACAALILQGKYDAVVAAIAAIPDPIQQALAKNAWENATTFDRHDPFTLQLGAAVGLTDADIDALFVLAATL